MELPPWLEIDSKRVAKMAGMATATKNGRNATTDGRNGCMELPPWLEIGGNILPFQIAGPDRNGKLNAGALPRLPLFWDIFPSVFGVFFPVLSAPFFVSFSSPLAN